MTDFFGMATAYQHRAVVQQSAGEVLRWVASAEQMAWSS